jgi:hypothetical protein
MPQCQNAARAHGGRRHTRRRQGREQIPAIEGGGTRPSPEPAASPPSFFELEAAIPLEARPPAVSGKSLTSLSSRTLGRAYPHLIIQLSGRRKGIKLRHALQIAAGEAPTPEPHQ